MKKILSLLVSLTAASTAFSYELENEDSAYDWGFSLSSTVVSRYVGSTGGALFIDQPCLQTAISAHNGSGLFFGVWRSVPLNQEYGRSFANETDYFIGYSEDVFRDKWNITGSFAVYDLLPVTDLYAFNLTASANTGDVRPFIIVEYDAAESAQLMPGFIYSVGANGELARKNLNWKVSFLGSIGPEPYGAKSDLLSSMRFTLSHPIKVGNGVITLGATLQKSFGQAGGLARDQTIFVAGYSVGL